MGADSLFSFDKWRDYEEIPDYATLLVAPRDEKSKADVVAKIDLFNNYFGKECFHLIDCTVIDCSSSEIRDSIMLDKKVNSCDNDDICSFLPVPVKEYIFSHNLYI